MKVFGKIAEARKWLQAQRRSGKKIVLVPTMGALHEGHLSLLLKGRALAGRRGIVGASIFVNPTQFGPREDFRRYPRPLARDLRLCRKAGADFVFHPKAFYAQDHSAWVNETLLSKRLCGRSRPGHFRGVCTVVAKLFNVVAPDIAIFGAKDYQQAQVIKRMTRDLDFPIRIVVAPTLRESGGLAMSSRNAYLSAKEKVRAREIRKSLVEARRLVRARPRPSSMLARNIKKTLRGFRVDYVEIVDAETLEPVKRARRGDCVAVAAFLGKTRLIDNIVL
jgi:pantoate--beta-alanine ligase